MIYKFIHKLLTRNKSQIPLFIVYFDYNKYKKYGKMNSCEVKMHPLIRDDEFIRTRLGEVIDYIRDNYDMEEM